MSSKVYRLRFDKFPLYVADVSESTILITLKELYKKIEEDEEVLLKTINIYEILYNFTLETGISCRFEKIKIDTYKIKKKIDNFKQ